MVSLYYLHPRAILTLGFEEGVLWMDGAGIAEFNFGSDCGEWVSDNMTGH